jgi:predicted dehydrogenase
MSDTIHVAVVGLGRMGSHHARVYSQMPGVKLLAVVDTNRAAAQRAAEQYNCTAFDSLDALLAADLPLDAATIAVPTIAHRPIAEKLLHRGIDLLIEKPLAPSVADARAIVDLAHTHSRVLQVGHTERFNPAVRAIRKYEVNPQFIEVHRISPMTFRSIDIGVVLDLMIHDIDIVHHLVKSPVKEVTAVGVSVIGEFEDIANARLTFKNGCVANLTASRLALKTERKMRLFAPTAYLTVDYQKKAGAVITRTANEEQLAKVREQVRAGQFADLTELNYPELVKYEDLVVDDKDPLRAEQEAFIHAVRTRGTPEVTGEDGLAAVDIAAQITQSIAANSSRDVPEVLRTIDAR